MRRLPARCRIKLSTTEDTGDAEEIMFWTGLNPLSSVSPCGGEVILQRSLRLGLRRIRSCHQEPRLRREDVCGVRRTDGLAALVERDEADAALHDERVLPRGDHVSEAHAPDRV